jgi:hypothetical protein
MACELNVFADEASFKAYIKQLEKLKTYLSDKGETVVNLPNGIVLYNDDLGVAGTPDLITVDGKGDYRIYDLKTKQGEIADASGKIIPGRFQPNTKGKISSLDESYEDKSSGKKKMSNRTKYNRQMTMYDILANNTHGIKFKEAAIIPLEATRQDNIADYSVGETKFVLTEAAMKATLYPKLTPAEDGKVDYKGDPIATYLEGEEAPTRPIEDVTPKPKQSSPNALTNDRGMHIKPDTKSSQITVDEDGNALGAFTTLKNATVGPQTENDKPIEEDRRLLENPEVGKKGSKISLRGVVTDQYFEEYEQNREDAFGNLPIYIYDEDGRILGRVPQYYGQDDKALQNFRKDFYAEFRNNKEHSVDATITAKKVQTNSNINNARTTDGTTFFYTLQDSFENTYHYDENGNLKFGEAPLIILSMRGATRAAMQWNYKMGQIETLSEKQLQKLDNDLADTAPATMELLKGGRIGVAIVDPVTGKYKVVPVTTRTLTQTAIKKVTDAFLDNDLETVHLIAGVNALEDEHTGTNKTFLKFAAFEKRGDQTIYDKDGKEITTLNDLLEADFDGSFQDVQERYRELKEDEKDFVVYFYSDSKADITKDGGIVRISAENLRSAINGEEFDFTSVSLKANKANKTTFRKDDALTDEDKETVRASIVDDFQTLLGRKRFQVDTALVNREESFFPNRFKSPLTGNSYNTYLDYLNSEEEDLGNPGEGKGAQSILITDIYNDEGALHHDIGLEFSTGEVSNEQFADDTAEATVPEQTEVETNDQGVDIDPWQQEGSSPTQPTQQSGEDVTQIKEEEITQEYLDNLSDDALEQLYNRSKKEWNSRIGSGEGTKWKRVVELVSKEQTWRKPPFRIGEESPEETIQRESAIAYLESRFPGFGVNIFEKAKQVGNGMSHGWFENMAFHVWANAEVGTEYHEAFHGMFRMFLTNEQRNSLYKQAGQNFTENDVNAKIEELKDLYDTITEKEARELALEELMAEGFRNYVITEEEDKGGFGKAILDFFKDLYLFIKALVTDNLTMKQTFRIANARTGTLLGRTKAKMLRNSDKFITENSYINTPHSYKRGLSDAQVKAVSAQVARHTMDQLDLAEEEGEVINQFGEFGSIPMYYLSHSMSIEENGQRVPLPVNLAAEYKKLYKEGGFKAVAPLIKSRGILGTPPDSIKGSQKRKKTIFAVFHDIGVNWEDTLDNSEFNNIEARGWKHFVQNDLAQRNIKTKFKGLEEITLDENEDTIIDKIFNLASEEVDPRAKMSSKIKSIISRIEDPIPNFMGYKAYLNPDEVYRMIIANAINSRDYAEMISNLEYAGRGIEGIGKVAEAIKKLTIQEKALIRHGFTLAANKFFTIRKRLNINEFGEVQSVSYAMFNPDRRSQVIDGVTRTKHRVYQEAGKNKRALYNVRINKSTTAKEYIPIKKNVKIVQELYEEFLELYIDRKSDNAKVIKAAGKVLYNLGIWYGANEQQHTNNFRKVLIQGIKVKDQVVQGKQAIDALFYPRGMDASIDLLIEGIAVAGKSVFDTETSTLTHLLKPLEQLSLPFTNSFIDNNKSKYPVNAPKGYNDIQFAVNSGEIRESLSEDEIFTPHPRLKTLLAYLADRPDFRKEFEIVQFSSYADSTDYEAKDYKTRGPRTALIVALNAFLNQGSEEYAYVKTPTPGDRQGDWYQKVARMSSKLLKNFDKRGILENMILAELTKISKARSTVESAIYNLDEKTSEEIAEDLQTLITPFHIPDEIVDENGNVVEINYSKPRRAAEQIAKARELGQIGTGEQFSIFDVLNDEVFSDTATLSNYIDEYINHKVGESSSMSDKQLDAFEEKISEMLDTLEQSISKEIGKVYDKFEDLGISQNSIDSDAFDKAENYTNFDELVEDFVFTDMVYRAEFAKAFRGGIDFAGNPIKFYKRMSTMGTPGPTLTLQSELAGEEKGNIEDYGMLDEFNVGSFYDVGWVSTKRDVSNYKKDVEAMSKAIGGEIGDVVKAANQPNAIEGVDGTALISLKMYRHIRMGEGKWDEVLDENAYQEYKVTGKFNRPLYILKPLYDSRFMSNGKNTHRVDKTAFVPISKELTENRPGIDMIRQRMEGEGIYQDAPALHVMYAVSAQKLSRQGTIPIAVNNERLTTNSLLNAPITTLPGEGLRIVQPTVEAEKNKIKIQRQFRKNIIANIFKDGSYTLGGKTIKGQKVFDLFHKAIDLKVNKSLAGFMKDLGFDDLRTALQEDSREAVTRAKTKFLRKFQNILREEIEERGLNMNYQDAIKLVADKFQGIGFNTPLSFPTLERKFENIFFAVFKARVLRQEIQGMEVPQIAELGGYVTDGIEQNKLKFTRIKGEKVIAAEAAVSKKMLKKMGAKVGDEIVGFRVPNQGMSSMVVFTIARVLPDSYEKAIMVPTPITTLMGSDFDIDKMFLMFSDTSKKAEIDYDSLLSGRTTASSLNNKQLTNLMLDVSKSVLLNKQHLSETQRPLDSPLLGDIRDMLLEQAPQVRLETDPETGKEIIRFNSILTEVEMEMRNKLGIAKRGSYANIIAGRNVAVHGAVGINGDVAPMINGEVYADIVSKSRTDEKSLEFIKNTIGIDVLSAEYTDYYISLYLSAAVDAANDPLQHYLNDTPATTRATSLMLSTGVDPVTIAVFLNQPIIRAITEEYAKREATPNMLRGIAEELVFDKYNKAVLPEGLLAVDMNIEELYESLNEENFIDEETDLPSKEYVSRQLEYVVNFLAFTAAGGELNRAYKVITPDNASNMGQSAGLQAYMDAHDALIYDINQENYVTGVRNILEEDYYPFEKTYVDAFRSVLDASGFLFNSYSPAAFYFKDRLKPLLGKAAFTEDEHNLINRAINYHLLTSEGSPLATLLDSNDINKRYFSAVGIDEETGEEVFDDAKGIISIYTNMGELYPKLAETSLYKALSPNTEYLVTTDEKANYFSYLVMGDKPRIVDEANDMISQFEDLLFNPEIFVNEGVSEEKKEIEKEEIIQFGEMLIQNSMITKGFSLGANSYSEIIPTRWIEASGTSEFFREKEIELDEQTALDSFIFDFMRQFGTSLAPTISSDKANGLPLQINLVRSDGTFDNARGSFSTFAKVPSVYGTHLYMLDKVYKKDKKKVAVYTKVMQKGRAGRFIEHNLRVNQQIDNDKSLIRLGEMDISGKYGMAGLTYFGVMNKVYEKGKGKIGKTFLEANLGLPLDSTRSGSTVTKKCK